MSDEQTTTTVTSTETPVVPPSTSTPSGEASPQNTSPETPPKTPPSAKDWASVTQAEKKARAIESKAKEELKKFQADKAAWESEKAKNSISTLKEAFNSGRYEDFEKEFPGLLKKLVQNSVKNQPGAKGSGTVSPKNPNAPQQPQISEEAILKKFEERQASKEKERLEKLGVETFKMHTAEFTKQMTVNKDKYPLLNIENEENPQAITETLKAIVRGDHGDMSYIQACEKIEEVLVNKLQKRQKVLSGKTTPGSQEQTPKTETANSPNKDKDTQGQNRSSDGPTTISQRMTQESSLVAHNNKDSSVKEDENSPTVKIHRAQQAEQAAMEKAIADYKNYLNKTKS